MKHYWNRINRYNKNWLCIVCGATGSGKSYTALKIAETVDPNFNIKKVVFTAKDFMNLINCLLKGYMEMTGSGLFGDWRFSGKPEGR